MVAFRNWVRTFVAAAPEREFVNVTGAGILHGPGIAQASVADVLGTMPIIEGVERMLNATRRSSFADAVPKLRSAIESVTGDKFPSQPDVWRTWADAVPNFDEVHTRRLLRHAGHRLRAETGESAMTTGETDWVDVPFEPSDFSAKAPLQWAVGQSSVATYAYRVHGKTMTLAFKIENSALEVESEPNSLSSNELHLRIPGNYLPARGIANAIWMGGVAGRECGYATVHPGLGIVVVFRGSEGPFPPDPGHFCLFGQLAFEVQ